MIGVFIVMKDQDHNISFSRGSSRERHVTLPVATSSTNELIKPAVELAEQLFLNGRAYKKAGVLLSGLVPDENIQGNLFTDKKNKRFLMDMLDNINFSMRDDMVKFASSGTKRDWKMRQEMRSPRYTSRWEEIRIVS